MRMTEDAQDIVLKLQQQIDDACKSSENLENEFSWKIVFIEKNRQNEKNTTKEDEDVIQSHKDDAEEGLKIAKKIREVLEIARTLAYENFKKKK